MRLEQSVKDLGSKRDETVKIKGESERAVKYFGYLTQESEGQKNVVQGVDLDALPQSLH